MPKSQHIAEKWMRVALDTQHAETLSGYTKALHKRTVDRYGENPTLLQVMSEACISAMNEYQLWKRSMDD